MTAETVSDYNRLIREFRAEGDSSIAEHSGRFFKSGEGEYGEGDRFLGIRVPVTRKYAKRYRDLELSAVRKLLQSEYHEERLLAALLLVYRFDSAGDEQRERIYDLYMEMKDRINNWDIVDSSAPHIVGRWLEFRDKEVLFQLARSTSLWDRRIAIIATQHLIRQQKYHTTLELAEILLNDPADLIHKAVGWMLREVGERDREREEAFLREHYTEMPRTMLRYAIEKFPKELRQSYLKGTV